jgi:membrane fusion protein (multidrug efflux system)
MADNKRDENEITENKKIINNNRERNNNTDLEDDEEAKKPLFKRVSFYIGVVIIFGVIIAGVIWYRGTLGYVTSDDAFIDSDRLEIGAKVLGRVEDLYFDEGDTVRADQLVAALDSTDIIARLNQAKASLENIKQSISLAQVNLDKARMDFDRAKLQVQNKIIPQAEYDQAQNKLAASEAELKIAQSRYTAFTADLKVIQTQLDNTKLYTAIDGVISRKWVIVGNVVQPGQPIYSIYNNKAIWVTAELEETKIHQLTLGDSVEINVDAYPDHVFRGQVYEMGKSTASQFSLIPPSNASGNFTKVTQRIPVKISVKNESDRQIKFGLLPGMSVEVKIKVKDNG